MKWKRVLLYTVVLLVLGGSTLLMHYCITAFTMKQPLIQDLGPMSLNGISEPPPFVQQANNTDSRCGYGLKWTSLRLGTHHNTAFFAAYFDDRRGAPDRPAVIVLGYHMKSLKNFDLHCVFTFQNGSSECLSEPVRGIGSSCINIHDDGKLGTSFTYICRMTECESACTESEIPYTVAMSIGSNCKEQSETLPVQDCRLKATSIKKSIGVCPSPVYGLGLQELVEFIEMNKALGVDLVNLYLMPGLDNETIRHLHKRYSQNGTLEMYQWKELHMHKIIHYNGQLLAQHDCMYRNMYRVNYLIMEDLDELIIPLQQQNYMEMIKSFRVNSDTHSFRFLNRFYDISETRPHALPCKGMRLPKYFERTNQLNCVYGINLRPKYIMKPELVIQVAVHGVCQTIKGRVYHVPPKIAILGHYRNSIPKDCKDRGTSKQLALLKYRSLVIQQICT